MGKSGKPFELGRAGMPDTIRDCSTIIANFWGCWGELADIYS
jgi:hypothetical protein